MTADLPLSASKITIDVPDCNSFKALHSQVILKRFGILKCKAYFEFYKELTWCKYNKFGVVYFK